MMFAHRRQAACVMMACAILFCALDQARSDEAPPAATPGQPSTNTDDTAPAPKGGAAALVVDSQNLAGILGQDTLSRKGEKMGQIVDVLADHNGEVRAAIIDFGGFLGVGSRKIAVDWHAVHFVSGAKSVRIVLDFTREDVLGSHEYKPGQTVTILQPAPPVLPAAAPPAAAPPN
jgi:hypothetical protein